LLAFAQQLVGLRHGETKIERELFYCAHTLARSIFSTCMDRLIGRSIEDFGSGTPFMAHGLEMDTVHDRVVWRLMVVETKVDEQGD
jgi:hypothetical protein